MTDALHRKVNRNYTDSLMTGKVDVTESNKLIEGKACL